MIVLDASAAVPVLLNTPETAYAVQSRLVDAGNEIHVPHFFDLELMSVLRRKSFAGEIPPEREPDIFRDLETMNITRHSHTPFLRRIWELRHNVTAYDAAYIALAESLGAPLVTLDGRLAGASGIRARVEVIG